LDWKRLLPSTCFLQAIVAARGQEARLFELRAATDLAGVWCETSSPGDPHALMEPIFAAFDRGETKSDVRA